MSKTLRRISEYLRNPPSEALNPAAQRVATPLHGAVKLSGVSILNILMSP